MDTAVRSVFVNKEKKSLLHGPTQLILQLFMKYLLCTKFGELCISLLRFGFILDLGFGIDFDAGQ